jgi:hypothetical protein
MSMEIKTLLFNANTVTAETFTEKKQGAGYHQKRDSLHTFSYLLDGFVGSIKLQATLELHPGPNDWVDIVDTDLSANVAVSGNTSGNFTGNFIWIRAVYQLISGQIAEIRYIH